MIINSGRVEESGNLVELTRDLLSGDKTLCPRIMEDFSDFGYVPKGLRVMGSWCKHEELAIRAYEEKMKELRTNFKIIRYGLFINEA